MVYVCDILNLWIKISHVYTNAILWFYRRYSPANDCMSTCLMHVAKLKISRLVQYLTYITGFFSWSSYKNDEVVCRVEAEAHNKNMNKNVIKDWTFLVNHLAWLVNQHLTRHYQLLPMNRDECHAKEKMFSQGLEFLFLHVFNTERLTCGYIVA